MYNIFNVDILRPFVSLGLNGPQNLQTEPVYNFFTPDERTSEESGARFLGAGEIVQDDQLKTYYRDSNGRLTAEDNLKGRVPRFIKVSFDPPRISETILDTATGESSVSYRSHATEVTDFSQVRINMPEEYMLSLIHISEPTRPY